MYGPAKAGILIVASVVVLGLLAPLITLGIDLYKNPQALSYMIDGVRINQTHVKARITLVYEGRVPSTTSPWNWVILWCASARSPLATIL